jgi:hypothetical protein
MLEACEPQTKVRERTEARMQDTDGKDPRYADESPHSAAEQPHPEPERPVPAEEARRDDKPSQAEGER